MKKLIFTIATIALGLNANAQVGIGTTAPSASSMLDLTSASKGFLKPRMTTAQRIAVVSPAKGLEVFDTDFNSTWFYNGTAWINSANYWTLSGSNLYNNLGTNVGIGTSTINGQLQLANVVQNRKIVLHQNTNDDNQFYGFGINGYTLRYQTDNSLSDHVFFSAIDATSSKELMRVKGSGNVGIGTNAPVAKLHVAADKADYGELAQLMVTGADLNKKLLLGYNTTTNKSYIQSINTGVGSTDLMLQPTSGNVGIGLGASASTSSLLHVNGVITATKMQGPSDSRFKKNIKPIENALEKVLQLGGYTYDWKEASEFPTQSLGKGHDMGVIAQEVEKQFPEAVSTNAEGFKAVSYTELVPALIEAIKELQAQITKLKNK